MFVIIFCLTISIAAIFVLFLPIFFAINEGGRVEDTARDEVPERVLAFLMLFLSIWGFGIGWLLQGWQGIPLGIMLPFLFLGIRYAFVFRKDN